ncbi:response regulator [Ideonella sp. YS5]|uniref:response regulator n=1 Tax=Ideonella sp. YS5 TaxID=3453714 RepID=UPI003F72B698
MVDGDLYGRPGRPQVLYVEDEPTNLLLMQALFRLRPHLHLVTATDGAEVTALAPSIRPALILLDLRLPDCWGSDLLPQLRQRFRWRHVPAVAVTAEVEFDGSRSAFIETWHKPLDLKFVLERLDRWLPDTVQAEHTGQHWRPPAADKFEARA